MALVAGRLTTLESAILINRSCEEDIQLNITLAWIPGDRELLLNLESPTWAGNPLREGEQVEV